MAVFEVLPPGDLAGFLLGCQCAMFRDFRFGGETPMVEPPDNVDFATPTC